jgi:hypothetical protein
MKNIWILIFIGLCLGKLPQSMAQSRLGYTEAQIKEEFYGSTINSSVTNEGVKYLMIEFEDATVAHYLNKEKICYKSIMIPHTQRKLNYFVELYNREYVIISDTEWKAYVNNGIIYITLKLPRSYETNKIVSFAYHF